MKKTLYHLVLWRCLFLQYHGSSETYKEFLKGLNITFVVLFCFEAILKIIAYRLVSAFFILSIVFYIFFTNP